MTFIAEASATSTATPAAFFAKWADMATWPEWNQDTEWAELDGKFEQGATGVIKPKGGPKTKFVVTKLTDTEFIDSSKLIGARLIFAHEVTTDGERTTVQVRITMEGPLRGLWNKIMGGNLAKSLQGDVEALVAAAEAVLV
ncbi:SRPBCC family protein [Streptomyces sp. NPDC059083]|uniref:SRPBCC family protein n=1 Tax=Streptomyces sp. NPDC059083 TaxID=3346721 RepID=UPI003674FC28